MGFIIDYFINTNKDCFVNTVVEEYSNYFVNY